MYADKWKYRHRLSVARRLFSIPATKESLRIAEMGYQAGKISLLEFNSIKQVWLDKHLARFDLWLALQNQIAEVERNYVTNLDQE